MPHLLGSSQLRYLAPSIPHVIVHATSYNIHNLGNCLADRDVKMRTLMHQADNLGARENSMYHY